MLRYTCRETDDLALGLADDDFAHAIEGVALWDDHLGAGHLLQDSGEVLYLDVQAGSHR